MLVAQMVATFSRSMFLSHQANRQKHPKWFALYSVECDRTMNLYRKQMQSLAEYRRPRRRTFTAIRTANIAGQQVVMSGSTPGGRIGRKDGYARTVECIGENGEALPAKPRGKGGAAGGDLEEKTLGA
jgi:hypothetical protein